MGQTLEMLLAADVSKITDIPRGKIEIKRLSKQLGKPFFISFRAMTLDEMKDIAEKADGDQSEEMKWAVYEFSEDPNFKDEQLRDKYGVKRPVDIVNTILLGGEILRVYQAIAKLSGHDRAAGVEIEEIKN